MTLLTPTRQILQLLLQKLMQQLHSQLPILRQKLIQLLLESSMPLMLLYLVKHHQQLMREIKVRQMLMQLQQLKMERVLIALEM